MDLNPLHSPLLRRTAASLGTPGALANCRRAIEQPKRQETAVMRQLAVHLPLTDPSQLLHHQVG